MLDHNWDLINGDTAHAIEVLNHSNQANVIEALVLFLVHHGGVTAGPCPLCPNEGSLRELHRTGTLFLLHAPGIYREDQVYLTNNGTVVYTPPPHTEVPTLMATFAVDLEAMWDTANAVQLASYAIWRINWVHPFKNGNGRTARAFAYTCLCLKLGFVLGGAPTVIDLIMQNKPEFEAALRAADISLEASGASDLTLMNDFIERLLVQQLSSIP